MATQGEISSRTRGEGFYRIDGRRFKCLGISSAIEVDEQARAVGTAISVDPMEEVEEDSAQPVDV